jgi:hypothetical protein
MDDELKQLVQDCLEAYDMLTDRILVAHLDYELSDDEIFALFSRLHDRFRAIAPDWPQMNISLETPDVKETTLERLKRLTQK